MLVLAPGNYLSLDETLYSMQTQISFKQFNPSRPAKYGFLFKSVNAARYPYLIETLSANPSLAGRNISFDRLYTSIPSAKWLPEKRITCMGTMQLNRKGIPDELRETKNRELLSLEIYWDENSPLSISSYVVKTSKGKKKM